MGLLTKSLLYTFQDEDSIQLNSKHNLRLGD